MTSDHLSCYRTLGVVPGCTWQQLRDRYRLLAKQWHPDHFHAERAGDASGDESPEEKIKEINQAFFVLSRYHRTHGTLPLAAATEQTYHFSDSSDAAEHAEADAGTVTTPPPYSKQSNAPSPQSAATTQQPGRNSHLWVGGFAAVAALTYFLFTDPQDRTDTVAPAPATAPRATTHPALGEVSLPTTPTHFTLGSTVGEVHAIQGVPTRVDGDVWYYGDAAIWFHEGLVHRWKDDPNLPLKARLDMPEPIRARLFRVGSTMQEVRAIQGKPTHEGENVWDYGVSRVYFKGERVAGWDNSPLNPLKIRNR